MSTKPEGLRIESVEVGRISPVYDGYAHVDFDAQLYDKLTDAYSNISFSVPVQCEPDWTLERIHARALERAGDVVRALAAHFGEADS